MTSSHIFIVSILDLFPSIIKISNAQSTIAGSYIDRAYGTLKNMIIEFLVLKRN
jgi:hypothetical protein